MKKKFMFGRVAVIVCFMLLAGCGQKGDLYLPQGNYQVSGIG